jgi:hypothetical protein
MTDNSNYPWGVYESDFDDGEPEETEKEEAERLAKEQDYNDPNR